MKKSFFLNMYSSKYTLTHIIIFIFLCLLEAWSGMMQFAIIELTIINYRDTVDI